MNGGAAPYRLRIVHVVCTAAFAGVVTSAPSSGATSRRGAAAFIVYVGRGSEKPPRTRSSSGAEDSTVAEPVVSGTAVRDAAEADAGASAVTAGAAARAAGVSLTSGPSDSGAASGAA